MRGSIERAIIFNQAHIGLFDPILSALRKKSVVWATRTLYTREPSPPIHMASITTNLLTENVPTTSTSTANMPNRKHKQCARLPIGPEHSLEARAFHRARSAHNPAQNHAQCSEYVSLAAAIVVRAHAERALETCQGE